MTRQLAIAISLAASLAACRGSTDASSDPAMNAAADTVSNASSGLSVRGTPSLSPKLLASVCKAAMAESFQHSPKIMKVVSNEGGIVRISYRAPDDGRRWTDDCRLEGNRVVWRTVDVFGHNGPGAWRIRPEDDVLTFAIKGKSVDINTRFAGGSETSTEAFPIL